MSEEQPMYGTVFEMVIAALNRGTGLTPCTPVALGAGCLTRGLFPVNGAYRRQSIAAPLMRDSAKYGMQ